MEYTINVAERKQVCGRLTYIYYFSVTIYTYHHAIIVFNDLKSKYPEPDYKITVTKWEKIGQDIENFGENDQI